MSVALSRPVSQPQRFGRLWRLPANGHGNGLDDAGWVPVAGVSGPLAEPLLAAFGAASVPADAAPAAGYRRPRGTAARQDHRIWVRTSAYGRAEQALLTVFFAQPIAGRSRQRGPAGVRGACLLCPSPAEFTIALRRGAA